MYFIVVLCLLTGTFGKDGFADSPPSACPEVSCARGQVNAPLFPVNFQYSEERLGFLFRLEHGRVSVFEHGREPLGFLHTYCSPWHIYSPHKALPASMGPPSWWRAQASLPTPPS